MQQQYPNAAASLLEGLEEAFTVDRLTLTPALMGCLGTTNFTENPNVAGRICRWRDHEMVLHWMASEYMQAEKSLCPSTAIAIYGC